MKRLWAMTATVLMAAVFVAAGCSLSHAANPQKTSQPDKPAIGFEALTTFDRLPLLVDWPAYQDSSYSREHQNADAGNYLYSLVNGVKVKKIDRKKIKPTDKIEHVMVETDGPGVIYRIWSTGVTGKIPIINPKTRVRFFFDGEAKPRLDLPAAELFGQKGAKWPFVQPLSRTFESGKGDMEGPASLCYVPIPFAKSIKITTNGLFFYHFNYIKYPKGTPVESFSMALAQKHRATLEKAAQMLLARGQMPSPPKEPMLLTEGLVSIAPGKTGVLYEGVGPAVVRALKVKLFRAKNINLRGLVLQVRYEGSSKNSINVPIGDFYGATASDLRYRSLPMGTTDAGYYCYFPMPFRKKITIAVRNDTSKPAKLYRSIAVQKVQALPKNAGYFHAAYHQDKKPAKGVDYNILTAGGGRGKFVGCNMFMQGGIGTEAICFLEGDEAIYVDDDWKWPTRWVGTGTEDYFNGSYYWNGIHHEDTDQAFGGLTLRHGNMRRVCAYRWHITDFISFKRRIKVDMQHGPVSDFPSDYASTAYWYMSKPIAASGLPSLQDRVPRSERVAPIMMGCRFEGQFTTNGKPLQVRWLRQVDKEYWTDVYPASLSPKRMQIFCAAKEIGQDIKGKLYVPGEDHYKFQVFLTVGPSYGKVAVLLDGKLLRNLNAYNETFLPAKGFDLGQVRLKGGSHKLTFRILGRYEMATAMDFGLVAMQGTPMGARAIDKWLLIGPWPCPEKGGWQIVNPPEKEQNPKAVYDVTVTRYVHGKHQPIKVKAKWIPVTLPPGGGVASYAYYGWDSWQCCYGLTYVWSPRDQVAGAFMGKDDALAVWVNGKKVLDDNTWSIFLPDQLIAPLPLKKGWNKILVKNANWHGCWAWHMKMTDPKGELKVTNIPPPEFAGGK